jgi:hypothetical protein
MEENNITITQIQVGNSTYYLNATYLNGEPVNNYTIDGQSIFNSNSGDISIFKKYQQVDGGHQFLNTLTPNTKYIFKDPITSLDFTGEGFGWGNGDYIYCEYIFIFKCGDDVEITESDDDWYWADGAKPSLESGVRYELSVSVINTDGTGGENIVHAILVPFIN